MNARLMAIKEKRALLIEQAEAQRESISRYVHRFDAPLHCARQRWAMVQTVGLPVGLMIFGAVVLKTPWWKLRKLPRFLWSGWLALRFIRRLKI